MADWTNIPNVSIETGKPGRAIDGRALRDNPIAIAEGAPGAPGLWVRALKAASAGDVVKIHQTNTATAAGAFSVDMDSWGTVRLSVEARRTGGIGGSASFVRVRDGVSTTISTFSLTTSFSTYSADVSYRPKDILRIEIAAATSTGAGQASRNHTFSTSGDDLWFGSISPLGFAAEYQTYWTSP